jgi:hypothetical protein
MCTLNYTCKKSIYMAGRVQDSSFEKHIAFTQLHCCVDPDPDPVGYDLLDIKIVMYSLCNIILYCTYM